MLYKYVIFTIHVWYKIEFEKEYWYSSVTVIVCCIDTLGSPSEGVLIWEGLNSPSRRNRTTVGGGLRIYTYLCLNRFASFTRKNDLESKKFKTFMVSVCIPQP